MLLDLSPAKALGHRTQQLKANVNCLSPRSLALNPQAALHPKTQVQQSSMSPRNTLPSCEPHAAMNAPKYIQRCHSKASAGIVPTSSALERDDVVLSPKASDVSRDHHSPSTLPSNTHSTVTSIMSSPTISRPSLASSSLRQVSSPVSPVSPPFPSPGLFLGGLGTAGALHNATQPATAPGAQPPEQPALVVFSGGTAFNSVAGHLRRLTTRVTHILPVSDDGGSTAEVVRVLGGPAVGDIRSRCLRLADSSDTEAKAVKALLAHRLPAGDPAAAKQEWYQLVEGDHPLWQGVSEPYKHVIRGFMVHFHHQILAHASVRFNFSNGSIGNFFFAGARTFFRSLEAAIFLFSRVARIPEGCAVIPAICTEERISLGAELEDGSVIRGQNNISHPPAAGEGVWKVEKSDQEALPSPIRRVFYLSSHTYDEPASDGGIAPGMTRAFSPTPGSSMPMNTGMELEVLPQAHPTAVAEVGKADAILFGCGSLYTSICPTICLEGMGEAVASRHVHKILVLNGSHDRETSRCGAHDGPMTAADMVQAVSDALNRRRNRQGSRLLHAPAAYVTGLVYPEGGEVAVDMQALRFLGVRHVLGVRSQKDAAGRVVYDPHHLVQQIGAMLALPLDGQSSREAGQPVAALTSE